MRTLLELTGIAKQYGRVEALQGVDFVVRTGEVHALVGENGAGKTTLMRIAFGMVRPDRGGIQVEGQAVDFRSPRDASRHRIGMVHQHFTSVPALTVAENVALAAGWPVRAGDLRGRVASLARRIGVDLRPDAEAGQLGIAALQHLEVAKAIAGEVRVLLLDEPTAVMPPGEKAGILALVRRFAADGGGAVLITHKLEEALDSADSITVLRRGKVAFSGPNAGLSPARLAGYMFGEVRDGPPEEFAPAPLLPVVVAASGLAVPPAGRTSGVREATFSVRGGEVVGVAAVEGNGQRELLRAVAGLLVPRQGTLRIEGPVAFVPQDRTTEGLVAEFSLTENVVLGTGRQAGWVRHGLVDWQEAASRTRDLLRDYGIRASGAGAPASSLSGGNQQKLILARALSAGPRVVVAEDPARGLDPQSARAVHGRVRQAAARGAGVLFHASDLDEVLSLADRVLVVANGRVIEPPLGSSREQIGRAMLGGTNA